MVSRSKTIFKGKIIKLYLQKHKLPNGVSVEIELIKHPGAVLIVPFLSKDKIILIRQFRTVIGSYLWELPAGTLKKGEIMAFCAKRELIEETGYEAGTFRRIGFIYPAPGYTTEKIIIYKATGLKKVQAKTEADEIIESRIFSKNEARKLFKAGLINDAKTICALKLANII